MSPRWNIEERRVDAVGEAHWLVTINGYATRVAAEIDCEHLCPRNREWRVVEVPTTDEVAA